MNDGERLATLESQISNVNKELSSLWSNVDRRNQNHVEIMSTLAVIISKQDEFKNYQKECDDDRAVHKERINALENTNKTQKAVVTAIASVVSAVWGVVTFIFTK